MVTTDHVRAWIASSSDIGVTAPEPTEENEEILQRTLDAVIAHVERFYPAPESATPAGSLITDEQGNYLVTEDWNDALEVLVYYPASDWELAVVMQTARLWSRRNTPNGVAGAGEFGVIRVSAFDPDVERLLAPYRVWGFA